MHRKLLSFALGVGLMVGTVGPAFAQTSGEGSGQPNPQTSPGTTQNPSTPAQGGQGGGTAAGGVVTPPTGPTTTMTPAMLRKSVADFWAFTEKNWSIMGYSSAREARTVLGGDWFRDAAMMSGLQLSDSGTVVRDTCRVTTMAGTDSSQGSQQLPAGQCS